MIVLKKTSVGDNVKNGFYFSHYRPQDYPHGPKGRPQSIFFSTPKRASGN